MQEVLAFGWLGLYREPALLALVVVAATLFVVTLVFSAYAIVLRFENERRDRRREALWERWRTALLDAVADPDKVPTLHQLVEPRRRIHFVGFVLQFARRMRGEETALLRSIVGPYLGLIAERVQSKRSEVRARAAQTLGTLGLPDHEDLVIAALDDPSPLVAMVAARALAKEGDPTYGDAVLARVHRFSDWNRPYLASMLAAMGPELAPGLRRGLADREATPATRAVMCQALRLRSDFEAGDVAAEVAAETDDRELLAEALRLLAQLGRPSHLPVVRALAESSDEVVRAQALRALGHLGGEDEIGTLAGALDDEFAWAALYAARGLRESGGRQLLLSARAEGGRRGRLAAQVLAEQRDR